MSANLTLPATATRSIKILVVDSDPSTKAMVHLVPSEHPYQVRQTTQYSETASELAEFHPDVALVAAGSCAVGKSSDQESLSTLAEWMAVLKSSDPTLSVILLLDGGPAATEQAIEMLALGATDCIAKPISVPTLTARIGSALETRRLLRTPAITLPVTQVPQDHSPLVGKCDSMLAAYRAIAVAASHSHAVLVRGETGTGKSHAAMSVHRHSCRRSGPIHIVRCEPNVNEQADDKLATILADESTPWTLILEDFDLAAHGLQGRVLEWIRLRPASTINQSGGCPQAIVMTMRTPDQSDGTPNSLRRELFYEVRGGMIDLPNLRDRGDDLELLVEHFFSLLTQTQPLNGGRSQRIAPDVIRMLRAHSWPGNITELRSVLLAGLQQANGVLVANDFLRQLTKSTQRPLPAIYPPQAGATLSPASTTLTQAESALLSQQPKLQLRSPDYWTTTVDVLIARAIKDGVAETVHDDAEHRRRPVLPTSASDGFSTHAETVEALETGLLSAVLRRTGGNLAQSARLLGMTRVSLRKKIQALGLVIPGRGVST